MKKDLKVFVSVGMCLGVVEVIGALLICGGAYYYYSTEKPFYAAVYGVMALVCATCSIVSFKTARRLKHKISNKNL